MSKNSDNVFDLTKMAMSNTATNFNNDFNNTNQNSKVQQSINLTGYVQVPRDKWANIKPGQRVRYQKKDGKWVKGGMITNVSFDYLLIQSLGNKPITWKARFAGIVSVWAINGSGQVELNAPTQSSAQSAPMQQVPSDNLESRVQNLQDDVNELKKSIERMLKMINELHGLETKL
jgi:hypothetical protein